MKLKGLLITFLIIFMVSTAYGLLSYNEAEVDTLLDVVNAMSANGKDLTAADNYAEMRTLLDLEAGTDFYSKTAADLAFQPLESTLTDIADGTITENLVNTANPWADNEVADDITASNYIPLSGFTQDGGVLVGTAAGAYQEETGATLRTSIGVGTGDSPQFTGIELGHATDTTLTRAEAGEVDIEGNQIYHEGDEDTIIGAVIDAEIAALRDLTSASGKCVRFTGPGTAEVFDCTTAFKTIADDASVADILATLYPVRTSVPTGTDILSNRKYCFDNDTADPSSISGTDDYCSVAVLQYTGTHDGGDVAVLTDSGASFPTDGLIGWTVINDTQDLSATITDNDGTTVTGALGSNWADNDVYRIIKWVATEKTNGTPLYTSFPHHTYVSSELSDGTSPYQLTSVEVQGTQISNYGATGTEEYWHPTGADGINVVFLKFTDQTMRVCPITDGYLYYSEDGAAFTLLAQNECIENSTSEISRLTCISDSQGKIFCSEMGSWAEETPE